MTALIADRARTQSALSMTGFETVTAELRRATFLAIELGDIGGHEIVVPLEAYDAFRPKIEALWRQLSVIAYSDVRSPEYWTREHQYARLDKLRSYRFTEHDPLVWGLLLIHAERVVQEPRLGPESPRINRLAYGLGFLPDHRIGSGQLNQGLGLDALANSQYGAVPSTLATHVLAGDTIAAFNHFYQSKLGRLKRVSLRRKIELIKMNQSAVDALDFLKTTGEVYRGWLMVGFSFLAPYALAPELVAAGGVVTATGIRAAAQAEQIAAHVAGTEGARAMFAIIDLGPAFFDLALTLGKIFLNRPGDKPLTPGEVFELVMSGLGAIPSARLGYLLMGISIASPFQATQDFMAWLIQGAASIEAKVAAAEVDLELETYDSAHTLILDLDA